jgi:hypothetical protein
MSLKFSLDTQRNGGIRAAVGDWIAFLDSDDRWMPEKLARIAAAIRHYPEANFFCNSEYHRQLDGSEFLLDYGAAYLPNIPLRRQLFRENLFSTSAIVCRRDLLLTHGLFDEHLYGRRRELPWPSAEELSTATDSLSAALPGATGDPGARSWLGDLTPPHGQASCGEPGWRTSCRACLRSNRPLRAFSKLPRDLDRLASEYQPRGAVLLNPGLSSDHELRATQAAARPRVRVRGAEENRPDGLTIFFEERASGYRQLAGTSPRDSNSRRYLAPRSSWRPAPITIIRMAFCYHAATRTGQISPIFTHCESI